MTFTDDNFRRVKDALKLSKDCDLEHGDEFRVKDIEALIARLEAAENSRNEALEEAAKVAEGEPCTHCDVCPGLIARIIRALKK